MAGRLRLRGRALLRMGKGADNPHQLALRSKKSYATVKKYVETPDEMNYIDLDVLASILVDGQEITSDQILDLRIGDLFEYVNDR